MTWPLVSTRNDVWETSAQIPYWWCVTVRIRVVLLIGGGKFLANKTKLPRSGQNWFVGIILLTRFLVLVEVSWSARALKQRFLAMDGNRKKSFCILRRLFTPNFRPNRLYKRKETKQFKFSSVKPKVKSSASKIILECLILCGGEKPIRREMTSFYCYWQNPFRFSCHILFDNPGEVYITKTLICIRKQNPEVLWS